MQGRGEEKERKEKIDYEDEDDGKREERRVCGSLSRVPQSEAES